MLDTNLRKVIQPPVNKAGEWALKKGLTANRLTWLALIFGVLASISYIFFKSSLLILLFLWISGFLDMLDGTVARLSRTSSPIGTMIDILFDRIVEISIIIAFVINYPELLMASILLLGSSLLSMTVFLTSGAILENTGNKTFFYAPGLIERTEWFLAISLAIIFKDYAIYIFYILSSLIAYTALQRFVFFIKVIESSSEKK